jgi:hypothetical protein
LTFDEDEGKASYPQGSAYWCLCIVVVVFFGKAISIKDTHPSPHLGGAEELRGLVNGPLPRPPKIFSKFFFPFCLGWVQSGGIERPREQASF